MQIFAVVLPASGAGVAKEKRENRSRRRPDELE